jgi:hypothetical protein
VETSNRLLSSVHKVFISENTLSTAAFVPGRDKEYSTTVLIFFQSIIVSPSDLLRLTTTKPQKIILVILFFTTVISNIKAELYVLKLRATSAEKTWFLFVNVIQKFRKTVQMCVPPHMQARHGTQLSKSVLSAKIWTSGIPIQYPTPSSYQYCIYLYLIWHNTRGSTYSEGKHILGTTHNCCQLLGRLLKSIRQSVRLYAWNKSRTAEHILKKSDPVEFYKNLPTYPNFG